MGSIYNTDHFYYRADTTVSHTIYMEVQKEPHDLCDLN